MQSLATKYRPKKFEDVVGQSSIVRILQNQLKNNETKQAYLFIGSAGCGKTTCARIFANELNKGIGNPIELDAASHNSVDDIRELSKQAQTQSIESEYKVFILDELHMLSAGAWAAMLKLIEEPPAKTVFIGCTTNPEKIPKTILSRCQRFDFRRMQDAEIVSRLEYILQQEGFSGQMYGVGYEKEAIEFIAKKANGGMRDAITLLDKCLSYSDELTIDSVTEVLGEVSYGTYADLAFCIAERRAKDVVDIIEKVYKRGIDLKNFTSEFVAFLVDVDKYLLFNSFEFLSLPESVWLKDWMELYAGNVSASNVLRWAIDIKAEIKYDSNPRYLIEAMLLEAVR